MARSSLGGVGAWAEEAEREEAERKKEAEAEAEAAAASAAAAAAAAAGNKSRRKKNPTYSISEVTTGQYVGPGGRSRALPDARIFPFADRSVLSDQTSRGKGVVSFDLRQELDRKLDRKREALAVPTSRADKVDDWASAKRMSAVVPRDHLHSNSDRRGFPSQDGKITVESSSVSLSEPEEIVHQQAKVRSDPFAGARPREQVLADKEKVSLLDKDRVSQKDKMDATVKDGVSGVDKVSNVVEEKEEVIGEEKSRSSSSSRPPTPRGPELDSQAVPRKKKVNPFGEAKPREVLLEQRGVDYRKIDLELERRSVVRPESEKERILKEEIRALEKLVKNPIEGDSAKLVEGSGQVLDKEHTDNLQAQLTQKESELQELTLTPDDMVRLPQKQVDRPSSRSGCSDYSGKLVSRSEQSDISRGYNPERLGSLSLSGEITGEYDAEKPSLSSRETDTSRRFEPERRPGMVRGYDRRGSGFDRPGSQSGSGNFPGGHDTNRPGFHSDHAGFLAASDSGWSGPRLGYNGSFPGNGSERPRSNSGHFSVTRGYPPERLDSRSQRNNIPRAFDSERPNSGSWQSDARGYGSERFGSGHWHDDTRAYESERRGAGSWEGDARWYESAGSRPNSRGNDSLRRSAPERAVSLPARENILGSDFERPVSFAGHNERKRDVFDRLGPMPARREHPRRHNVGRLGSRPDSEGTHREYNAVDWQFGNEDSGRLHKVPDSYTACEFETMEPWPAHADIRRGYDPYRGSERSNNDQFVNKGSTYGEDFNRRRNHRPQEYDRRGNYALQNKSGQGRGVHVDHR